MKVRTNYQLFIKSIAYTTGLVSLAGTLFSPAIAYCNNLVLSRAVFITSLMFGYLSIGAFAIVWKYVSKRFAVQSLVCNAALLLFYIAPLISNNYNLSVLSLDTYLPAALLLILATILWGLIVVRKTKLRDETAYKHIQIQEYCPLIVLDVVIVLFIIISTHGMWQKWDSASYYRVLVYLRDFTFDPSDIRFLRPGGHLSYAFSIIYGYGFYFVKDPIIGMRVINAVLFVHAINLVYLILRKDFKCGSFSSFAGASLLAVTPYIIGTMHEVNLEILLISSLLTLYYASAHGYRIFELVAAFVLVFSKEIGIVYLTAFLVGVVARDYVCYANTKLISTRRDIFFKILKKYILLILPIIIFIIHTKLWPKPWGSGMTGIDSQRLPNLDYLNSIGINKVYSITKIQQLAIMDFTWVILLTIICLGIWIVAKSKKTYTRGSSCLFQVILARSIVLPMLLVYIAFVIIQMFYITYVFPRYIMMNAVYIAIVFGIIINKTDLGITSRRVIVGSIELLLVMQVFLNLDPLTKLVFPQVPTGTTTISSPARVIAYKRNNYVLQTDELSTSVMRLSPYAQINRQWGCFDLIINDVFNEVGYKSSDLILLYDAFKPISSFVYWGNSPYNYYDPTRGQVVLRYGDDFDYKNYEPIDWRVVSDGKDVPYSEKGRTFFLSFDFSEGRDKWIVERSQVLFQKKLVGHGWCVTLYELKKTS